MSEYTELDEEGEWRLSLLNAVKRVANALEMQVVESDSGRAYCFCDVCLALIWPEPRWRQDFHGRLQCPVCGEDNWYCTFCGPAVPPRKDTPEAEEFQKTGLCPKCRAAKGKAP